MGMKFLGLSHVALRVKDLAKSKAFYVGILGFNIVRESPTIILMQTAGLLIGIGGDDPKTEPTDTFNPFRVGLEHIALGVPNKAALERLKTALDAASVRNNGVEFDKGAKAWYISFYDPDGIAWEFYCMPLPIRFILQLGTLFGVKIPKQS